nr:hypothetical protein CFP56_10270 [Quercus suber]
MPRDGSGASDNAIEQGENLTHGVNAPADSSVDRSNKAAPAPEIEKGEALEGMNASGGGDGVAGNSGSGKGSIEVPEGAGK